jgi:hypothetical protein
MLERFPSLRAVLYANAAHRMFVELAATGFALRLLLDNAAAERREQDLMRWETDGGR